MTLLVLLLVAGVGGAVLATAIALGERRWRRRHG